MIEINCLTISSIPTNPANHQQIVQHSSEKSTCQQHIILELLGAPCNANTRNFRRKAPEAAALLKPDMLTLSYCAKTPKKRMTIYFMTLKVCIAYNKKRNMFPNVTAKGQEMLHKSTQASLAALASPGDGWQNCTSWHRIIYAKQIYRICVRGSWCTLPETNQTVEKITIWRCISYWKWWFSIVMLVFWRVSELAYCSWISHINRIWMIETINTLW